MRLTALTAAAFIAAAWSFTGDTAHGVGESGIRGTVVPCGLIHERAAPCANGVAGATVRVRRAGGRFVATAKADRQGRFRVALPAGAYSVRARAAGAHAGPVLAVDVPAHQWVRVVLAAGRSAPPAARGRAA